MQIDDVADKKKTGTTSLIAINAFGGGLRQQAKLACKFLRPQNFPKCIWMAPYMAPKAPNFP